MSISRNSKSISYISCEQVNLSSSLLDSPSPSQEESLALSPYELLLVHDINNSNNNHSYKSNKQHTYNGQNSIFPSSLSDDYDSSVASNILLSSNINDSNHHIDIKSYNSYELFIYNCWTIKKYSNNVNNNNNNNCDLLPISKQIEMFIKNFTSRREYLINLDEIELASFALFLSWSTTNEICRKYLASYSKYDVVINGFVSLLNEPDHDTNCLVIIVTCLSYLIEGHHLMQQVLSDSNIVQLMTLLISKIIYPSSTTKFINQEYSITICRLGLRKLLSIVIVNDSNAAINEGLNFIVKWWIRLYQATLGSGSGFETPSKLLPSYTTKIRVSPIPVVRNAIMIMSDLLHILPNLRIKIIREISTISANFSNGLSFFGCYIKSTDPRTVSISSILISTILNAFLDNPSLYNKNVHMKDEFNQILNASVLKLLQTYRITNNNDEDGEPFWLGPFSDITNLKCSSSKKKTKLSSQSNNIHGSLLLTFEPLHQVLVNLINKLVIFSSRVNSEMITRQAIDSMVFSLKFQYNFMMILEQSKPLPSSINYSLFSTTLRTLNIMYDSVDRSLVDYLKSTLNSIPEITDLRNFLRSKHRLTCDDDNLLIKMSKEGDLDVTTDDINVSDSSNNNQYLEIEMFTNSPLISVNSNGNETIKNSSNSFSIDVVEYNYDGDEKRQNFLDSQLKCIELEKKVESLQKMLSEEKAKNREKELPVVNEDLSLSKNFIEHKLKYYIDENKLLCNEMMTRDEVISSNKIRYDALEKEKSLQESALREAWESLASMSKLVEESKIELEISKAASHAYQENARNGISQLNKVKEDLFDTAAQVLTLQDQVKEKNDHMNELKNKIAIIQQEKNDAETNTIFITQQMNYLKQELERHGQKIEQENFQVKKENDELKQELNFTKEREEEISCQYEHALIEIEEMRIEMSNLQQLVETTKKREMNANKTLKELKKFMNKVSVPSTPGGMTQDDD